MLPEGWRKRAELNGLIQGVQLDSMSNAAALYAKVSTLEQICDLQLEELRCYASRRFSQLSEFMDIGTSGASEAR